jgi:hypothetical protein
VVTSALNFDTPDCHVTGGCDLYTTKAAGSDKKLYKNIDKSLESQHEALLKLGASLSPPQRESIAASLNLSRSSPFGPLSLNSSRRTFAYMIATLNASHPDYDFSHVLRPADFKRERNLRKVMSNIDSTINSVRPNSTFLDVAVPRNSPCAPSGTTAPPWGPQTWTIIDREMVLNSCVVFSYQPADDPFEEEEGCIWALHYFFFNKELKRVCYLYVRGVPVMSHSPRLRPLRGGRATAEWPSSMKRRKFGSEDFGAHKRARYWLGDHYAERITQFDEDIDEDDGLMWNRSPDGELSYGINDGDDDEDDEDYSEASQGEDDAQSRKPPVRGVSEDIAARMEIED